MKWWLIKHSASTTLSAIKDLDRSYSNSLLQPSYFRAADKITLPCMATKIAALERVFLSVNMGRQLQLHNKSMNKRGLLPKITLKHNIHTLNIHTVNMLLPKTIVNIPKLRLDIVLE